MRSGVTLEKIRTEVLMEAGLSTDPSHLTQQRDAINHLINRTERLIAAEADWPIREIEETVTVTANSQFGSLPANITFTQIRSVTVQFGQEWLPVRHGIGPAERSLYDTTARVVPISRWEIQTPGDTQYEVWPIGDVDQTLRFTGQKTFGEMSKDSDTCALDADVIVLRSAAELLARDGKRDEAQIKFQEAQRHMDMILRRQGASKAPIFNMADEPRESERLIPGIDFIPPG